MKAATVRELKQSLGDKSPKELIELCLRLSKYKKENKELLTYLLFEASNEEDYISSIKQEIEEEFSQINSKTYYYLAKGIRKTLRNTKKYIRYSQKKETEIELLIHFSAQMLQVKPSLLKGTAMQSLYERQINTVLKSIDKLHEDLQFDYESMMESHGVVQNTRCLPQSTKE